MIVFIVASAVALMVIFGGSGKSEDADFKLLMGKFIQIEEKIDILRENVDNLKRVVDARSNDRIKLGIPSE